MWVPVDKSSKKPMLRQVYEAVRSRILSGELPSGLKLPSTRALASQLNVSRNVILEAYELLLAEGFIEGRSGSGTYVAEGAVLPGYDSASADVPVAIQSADDLSPTPASISFRTGLPALDLFPRKTWAAILQSVCAEAMDRNLAYGDSAGERELRGELADYLSRSRGVIARPEQIVVTSGAVQAIQLIVRVLLSPGDEAVAEEPTNGDLRTIMTSTGASLRSIPVDEFGLNTSLLPADSRPKSVYVTPSHQFPLGGIMPIQRRVELIEYASAKECYIIEDDYDSEFRYDGAPIHSLQSLDPERVIYIGTFSKIMFPSLRIGYIVLPPLLVESFVRLKRHADFQTPSLAQLALARFIGRGILQSHVFKMKKVYRRRREALIESLEAQFGGRVRICGRPAGLHLVAEFDAALPEDLPERLRREDVFASPLAGNRILIGYGHLSEERIREGVARIGRAIGRMPRDEAAAGQRHTAQCPPLA